jgi:cell division protein FtsW (lipid II flippase)
MTVSRSSAAPRPVNFGRALLACLPATLVLGAIMVVGSIPTADSSRTLGRAVGMMIFSALLGALVVWLIARRRSWRFWKVVVLGSVLVLVLQLLTVSSQLS